MPPDNKQEQTESGGLGQFLVDLSNKAAGKVEETKPTSASSFPVYLILIGIVVIAFAVMGWLIVRARRQAAQLSYELRKKEEEQKRLVEDAKKVQNETARQEAESKIATLNASIEELKKKLSESEAAAAERAKALTQATTWNDITVVDKRGP